MKIYIFVDKPVNISVKLLDKNYDSPKIVAARNNLGIIYDIINLWHFYEGLCPLCGHSTRIHQHTIHICEECGATSEMREDQLITIMEETMRRKYNE